MKEPKVGDIVFVVLLHGFEKFIWIVVGGFHNECADDKEMDQGEFQQETDGNEEQSSQPCFSKVRVFLSRIPITKVR